MIRNQRAVYMRKSYSDVSDDLKLQEDKIDQMIINDLKKYL
jgi:hypothetical protein